MKKLLYFLLLPFALFVAFSGPGFAADIAPAMPGRNYPINQFLMAYRVVDLSTTYTNATTTPTIISSASGTTAVSIPATLGDYAKQYFRICYSVDATKATGTTGSVLIFANAATIAASKRFLSSTLEGTISGCYTVARSSAAAQTISLYGVSADTSIFTVSAAYIEVWNLQVGG